MGDVKEAVKGSGSSRKSSAGQPQNIVDQLRALREEVSALTAKKDEDALSEGDAAKTENVRKAALLRAVSSLLVSATNLLEDY